MRLRPFGFILVLMLSAAASAQPPEVNHNLTKYWTPELGECPQVLWLPERAPALDVVRTAGRLESLLARYPYQVMVQGSWVTLRLDGKVETIELMDASGSHQLFKSKRYLVSLLRRACQDLSPQEALCDVDVVARRLDPPDARVFRMVEYFGCFDEQIPGLAIQPTSRAEPLVQAEGSS